MFKNLRALRKSKGMSQDEFAQAILMPASTYSGYERQIREPDAEFWTKIAEKYQVSVDYLIGFCDNPHGTKYGGFQLTAEEEGLVTAWRSADERAREDVAHALRNFGFEYDQDQEKESAS